MNSNNITTSITKSLIIPVYKNELNIPDLTTAVDSIANIEGKNFEVVFVVDGSPDNSLEMLGKLLPNKPYSSQLISLSRNFGAFSAIRVGLSRARGRFVAVMAADLQEPPEIIHQFFAALEGGSTDIVFGQRVGRADPMIKTFFSNTFWAIYRKVAIPEIPKGGVDIFACNQKAKEALLSIEESNSSLVSQLFWVGYRRLFIPYERKQREHGDSAWSISKRFRYMVDSIFSFSDLPILLILWIGVIGVTLSTALGLVTIVGKLTGSISIPGYTTIILVSAFFCSGVILTQGIIGCYLWRTFENTKKRPLSIVDKVKKFN
jgi:polyisoprenyl-phosphate glycosyltransferase